MKHTDNHVPAKKTASEEQLERVREEAARLLAIVETTEFRHFRYWNEDTMQRFGELYNSLKRFQGEK